MHLGALLILAACAGPRSSTRLLAEAGTWLTFPDAEDSDGKCALHTEVFDVPLAGGRRYVEAQNAWCGGRVCKVTGPDGLVDAPCFEGPGVSLSIGVRPVMDDWFEVTSQAEGCLDYSLQRYTPETGSRFVMRTHLGCGAGTVDADVMRGVIHLTSDCDLAGEGCTGTGPPPGPARTWRVDADGQLTLVGG